MQSDQSRLLEDAARLASQKNLIRFTRFLDPAEVQLARQIARVHGAGFSCWGGYAEAERVIGCFHPLGELVDEGEYPLVCLQSALNTRFGTITHRDLLGAFMALGLTRSCIGDMIISDTAVFLFTVSQTADFVASSFTSAGRISLDFSVLPQIPAMPEPKGSAFQAVVSSLRLDAVLACAYRFSRSESAEYIRAGLVKVDHLPCERPDAQLKEGTLLSVRGKGRIRMTAVNGLTRKQRIGITLFRYE